VDKHHANNHKSGQHEKQRMHTMEIEVSEEADPSGEGPLPKAALTESSLRMQKMRQCMELRTRSDTLGTQKESLEPHEDQGQQFVQVVNFWKVYIYKLKKERQKEVRGPAGIYLAHEPLYWRSAMIRAAERTMIRPALSGVLVPDLPPGRAPAPLSPHGLPERHSPGPPGAVTRPGRFPQ